MTDFVSLLPANATDFERAMEQATARLADIPVTIRNYLKADSIPEALIPWLGWEWSVDSWSSEWSVTTKRNLLRNSFKYHQQKGTRISVENALKSLGSHIAIKEWWQYKSPKSPYTFDAVIDTRSGKGTGILQYQLIDAINNAMPVRCHYTVTVSTQSASSLNMYCYARVARFQRLVLNDA